MQKPLYTPFIYLAGPDVFSLNCNLTIEKYRAILAKHLMLALTPSDNSSNCREEIFSLNIEMIKRCDGVIANLTPFRSPHCDVGTAGEVGFAYGLGIPVIGFTDNYCTLISRFDKVANYDGNKVDENGFIIEDFGLVENLMLHGFCFNIVDSFETAVVALADKLKIT